MLYNIALVSALLKLISKVPIMLIKSHFWRELLAVIQKGCVQADINLRLILGTKYN